METKTFRKGKVIFNEGEVGDCMYDLYMGRVGIYANYGTEDQRMLTEYFADQYFGEMGLLDSAPRSATAVALSDDTVLDVIAESDFRAVFEENPEQFMYMLQQMSSRLRRLTRDYAEACRTVADVVEAEKAGEEKSDALRHRIAKTLAGYQNAVPAEEE